MARANEDSGNSANMPREGEDSGSNDTDLGEIDCACSSATTRAPGYETSTLCSFCEEQGGWLLAYLPDTPGWTSGLIMSRLDRCCEWPSRVSGARALPADAEEGEEEEEKDHA